MAKYVIDEAKRCLQCKVPKCKAGCPVNTPVNEIVKMLLDGDITKAGDVLFNNNPLSVICSLVCPHDKQCEGHCILGIKSSPVQISSIEHYISDYYLNFIKNTSSLDKKKRVAIIGSGPAGITIAFILASKGYNITIFEANDKIGGVLRYGIPEYRLPKIILEKYKEKLVSMGIKIRPNTLIGPHLTIDDLFRDGYKAIFIGTGVWKPKTLGIKGESLGNVHFAIDYLKNPDVYYLGKSVCIIGAGNVAMDVARTAIRKGASQVYVMYRGSEDTVTAEKDEIEYAKIEGVKFAYFKHPVEIVDEGVISINTKVETFEDGTSGIVNIEGSEELFEADSVVISIGQGPKSNIVSTTKNLNVDKKGLIKTNELGYTTKDGVFASGDVVTGAKTVVEAVRLSKIVADAIDEYVMKKLKEE